MNKIFRIVWSHATQSWVVVSELTRAHKKQSSSNAQRSAVKFSGRFIKYSAIALALLSGHSAYAVNASGTGGDGAVAWGENSTANGVSAAIGNGAKATGGDSFAVLWNAKATGNTSMAIGNRTTASGDNSIALGSSDTTASGESAVAIGKESKAQGYSSVALGEGANAVNNRSVAIGRGATIANGDDTIAIGSNSQARGNGGIVIGKNSKITDGAAEGAVVIGEDAFSEGSGYGNRPNTVVGRGAYTAFGENGTYRLNASTAIGMQAGAGVIVDPNNNRKLVNNNTNADNNAEVLVKAGYGVDPNAPADTKAALQAGSVHDGLVFYRKNHINEGTAIGVESRAVGDQSIAIGGQVVAGDGVVALGGNDTDQLRHNKYQVATDDAVRTTNVGTIDDYNLAYTESTNTVEGQYEKLVGRGMPTAYKSTYGQSGSVVIGMEAHSTTALGTAIGTNSVVRMGAFGATAIGAGSTVQPNAEAAVAIGMGSVANGAYALAGGTASWAEFGDIALGYQAKATGKDGAIAMGRATNAQGDSSIMIGGANIASAAAQNTSFEKGNGTETKKTVIEKVNGKDVTREYTFAGTTTTTGTVAEAFKELTGRDMDTSALNFADQKYKNGHASTSLGVHALSRGDLGTAIGAGSRADSIGSVALGVGARANRQNAVAIGTGSTTELVGSRQLSVSYDKDGNIVDDNSPNKEYTFSWAGGINTAEGDVVSFGSSGAERQLKNVAAGRVAEDSTDAINGSQLNSVAKKVASGWIIAGNDKTKVEGIGSDHQVNFVNGQGTTVTVEKQSADSDKNIAKGANVKFDVKAADDTITVGADGVKVNTGNITKAAVPTVTAEDENKIATVGNVVEAIKAAAWKATSAATTSGENTGKSDQEVKAGDTVTFEADKNIKIAQANGKFTFSTKDNVEFTTVKVGNTANGKKPVELKNGDVINANNNPTQPTTALNVSSDNKPTQITGVGSVLNTEAVPTIPAGTATDAAQQPKLVNLGTAHGQPALGDNVLNAAATVRDLASMGWVVSSDKTTDATTGEYKDVVKNANEVKFVGKNAAKVSGKTDPTTGIRTITVDVEVPDVKTAELVSSKDGSVIAPSSDPALQKALNDAKDELAAAATPEQKEAAENKVKAAETALNNALDDKGVATAKNVADMINASGFTLKTSNVDGGEKVSGDDEVINPGKAVEMIAGKNLTVKQEANGKVTYATKDNVSFNTVNVGDNTYVDDKGNPVTKKEDGSFVDAQGNTVDKTKVTKLEPVAMKAEKAKPASNNETGKEPTTALNVSSSDGKPTQITGVGSTLNVNPVNTNTNGTPTAEAARPNLVDLVGTDKAPVNKNAAATVGDLQNMGWVVSTKDGNGYTDVVKNANQVDFKGTGLATVTGETDKDSGIRTITVNVDAQKTVEAAQTPVVYTDSKGNKVTKIDGKFYPEGSVKLADGKVYPKGTELKDGKPVDKEGNPVTALTTPLNNSDVKASMNDGDNATKPMQLANVGSNLPTVKDGDDKKAYNPNSITPIDGKDNKGAPITAKQAADLLNPTIVNDEGQTVANPNFRGNNAATVSDVLNAGWNLKNNDKARDFVKPYDTVNFINGKGTVAVVETADDATSSTVKFDVDAGEITSNTNGSVTGPTTAENAKKLAEDLAAAQKALNDLPADADDAAKKKAQDALKAAQDAAAPLNKVATAQNVADMINNSGFTLKADKTEGDNLTAADLANGEMINPGDTITMKAGKNMSVKHEQDGSITYATKDEVEFNTVKVGNPNTYVDNNGKPLVKVGDNYYKPEQLENGKPKDGEMPVDPATVKNQVAPVNMKTEAATPANNNVGKDGNSTQPTTALNFTSGEGDNAKPTQLKGVGSVLNTEPQPTSTGKQGDTPAIAGNQNLVNLGNDPITGKSSLAPEILNSAATVGDLANMGWMVSAKDNNYTNTVKNANKVEFKGSNGVEVTGKTLDDGTREITVALKEGKVTNNVTITKADGSETHAVRGEDGKIYEKDPVTGKATTTEIKVAPTDTVTNDGNAYVTGNTVATAIQKSGWNIGIGSTTKEFSKEEKVHEKVNPNDNVKYVNGDNTTVSMAVDSAEDKDGKKVTTTYVKFDVNAADLTHNTNGTVNGPVTAEMKKALDEAKKALADLPANATPEAKKAAEDKVNAAQANINNVGNPVATTQSVADAINNSGWRTNSTTATGGAKDTLINPGKAVNFEAGKNMEVAQKVDNDGNVAYTYATKDNVQFNSVQFGDANGPKITNNGRNINISGPDGKAPTKITGVAAGDISPNSTDAVNGAQIYALSRGNVPNVKNITDAAGNTYNDVIVDENGTPILKTYNVQGQKEIITNSVVEAIHNMNEQGIKFFHSNDGVNRPKVETANSFDSSASGKFATAIGKSAVAHGDNAVAMGDSSKALGNDSIAIGTGNIVEANNSGAFGDPNVIKADATGSYAFGNNNVITTKNTFVLGNDVNNAGNSTSREGTVENSVYLGNKSTATAGDGSRTASLYNIKQDGTKGTSTTAGSVGTVTTATVGNMTYGGFQGAKANGVVSVGAAGDERRIQNVAAGEISSTSTDAINGSQLYSVAKGVGNRINNLQGQINKLGNRMNAGMATSAAMANLLQPHKPGQSVATAGVGQHKNQSAVAVGYSRISDNGKYGVRFSMGANTQGEVTGGAAVGYFW